MSHNISNFRMWGARDIYKGIKCTWRMSVWLQDVSSPRPQISIRPEHHHFWVIRPTKRTPRRRLTDNHSTNLQLGDSLCVDKLRVRNPAARMTPVRIREAPKQPGDNWRLVTCCCLSLPESCAPRAAPSRVWIRRERPHDCLTRAKASARTPQVRRCLGLGGGIGWREWWLRTESQDW